MSSIKETRNLLSVSCVTGIINANEFAILYVNISVRQLWRILTGQFQQRKMHSRISCWEKWFACFGRCPLFHCLKEGLCILFKRLAYHSRYNDMIPDLADLSQKLASWPMLFSTGFTMNMATTLLILTSSSSSVLLCEHMQMQSIKRVWRWITAGVLLMVLSALFATHSKISELSTIATKGYMPWSSNLL